MDKPRSIRWFGPSFLGALALNLLGVVIVWSQLVPSMAAARGLNHLGVGAVRLIVAAGAALPVLIGLLLWYFVTRRRSTVARWLVVLTLACAIYTTVVELARGGGAGTPAFVCAAVSVLLEIVALAMLFMPDARRWFAGRSDRP